MRGWLWPQPFCEWFESLNAQAAAKVTICVIRLGYGHRSALKGVGAGLHECRIDFGPGYRVHVGFDNETLGVLLGGGTTKRQQLDVSRPNRLGRF